MWLGIHEHLGQFPPTMFCLESPEVFLGLEHSIFPFAVTSSVPNVFIRALVPSPEKSNQEKWEGLLDDTRFSPVSKLCWSALLLSENCSCAGKNLKPTHPWKTTADVVKTPTFSGTDAEELSTWCVVFSCTCCSKISLQKGDAVKPGASSSSRASGLGVFLTSAP